MRQPPRYLLLESTGELHRRSKSLVSRLQHCDICPRHCGVNRLLGNEGFCRGGRWAVVSNVCDHHGEEPAISGTGGSGALFLGGCNLRCVYCQNFQISQPETRVMAEMDASGIADQMILLQVKGCHNINWVSPTHYVPQLVEALVLAVERGLNIPIVYNTNAYDSLDTLEVLEDIVDIYLPDTKYSSDTFAKKYSQVADYVEVSRIAIREMHRQVGDLVLAENGVAERGLIVRHLILPNGIAGSRETMEWISSGLSPIVTLSVMSQYFPSHKAHQYMELSRSINLDEYLEVVDLLDTLGMEEGWLQEMSSSENYQPDFSREGHPFEPTR